MKIHVSRIVSFALIFLVVGLFFQFYTSSKYSSEDKTKPIIGNVDAFLNRYEQWKEMAKKGGADRNLVLPLGYSKALSFKFTNAHGIAKLDLTNGSISIEVSGLPEKDAFDVWLVDNKSGPKESVKPEPWDTMVHIGSLKHKGEASRLEARLDREALKSFKIDLIVVAVSSKGPGEAGLLFGSPSLFQRLYYSEQRGQVVKLGFDTSPANSLGDQTDLSFPFNFLVPKPALAAGEETPSLEEMVAFGEELFFEETFDGNSRTCGTCHPMENNLTIDPEFIETRPDNDPLFVAEFNPNLANNFEKPELMREFGLILENVDGFSDLENKFVMRGVPHTLALLTSIRQASNLPANEAHPVEMTGWSGDGAPGTGSLREFAIGAVTQHFTKTLARVAGTDFRLPNDEELDAMEAFQLALGRQADPNLNALVLTDANASTGKTIFINGTGDGVTTPGGKCNTCHLNAGAAANNAGENRNFNTGAEDLPNIPAKLFDPTIPRDGGFGTVNRSPANCTTAPSTTCGFGDGRFNSTPLVEAADTGPFFHNNPVNTIEEAIAFFNGDQFNNNPNNPRALSGQIQMNDTQVTQVATFLRVINALENIRSAVQFGNSALQANDLNSAQKPLAVALAELEDAIEVLDEKNLHPNAVDHLMTSADHIAHAMNTSKTAKRNKFINKAKDKEIKARGEICQVGSDTVLCPN